MLRCPSVHAYAMRRRVRQCLMKFFDVDKIDMIHGIMKETGAIIAGSAVTAMAAAGDWDVGRLDIVVIGWQRRQVHYVLLDAGYQGKRLGSVAMRCRMNGMRTTRRQRFLTTIHVGSTRNVTIWLTGNDIQDNTTPLYCVNVLLYCLSEAGQTDAIRLSLSGSKNYINE